MHVDIQNSFACSQWRNWLYTEVYKRSIQCVVDRNHVIFHPSAGIVSLQHVSGPNRDILIENCRSLVI